MIKRERPRRTKPSGQPTIDDVARHAGVSKGTVSHVLSGKIPVSPAMRARVEHSIQALGFRPAESARSLTARKRYVEGERRLSPNLPQLTAVGYVSVDFIGVLDRLPDREERRQARAIIKSIGGPAANVAAVAAGVGEPYALSVSLITAIGIDQDSDWAAAELAARRVDLIVPPDQRDERLNRAIVLVEADGRRTIINEPSNLSDVDVDRFIRSVDPAGLKWCLHFEGYQVPAQFPAVLRARERGFVTSMQATGLPPAWLRANHEALFAAFDVMIMHRESLAQLGYGEAVEDGLARLAKRAAATRGAWPGLVAVTLGPDGAAAILPDGAIMRAPALPVEVVDTTGAGDSFVGALLAAWLNDAPAGTAVQLACIAGSLQITQFGAQEIRPNAATLHRLADSLRAAPAALASA